MNSSIWKYLVIVVILSVNIATAVQPISSKEVKCLVCKITIQEMELAIAKVDPNKVVEVGGFRMDTSGNANNRKIQYSKSETYLTELMETICDKMDDYAKARYKATGKPTVLKMMTDGGMNPDISEVDFIQEGDLNKSLKHFCLEILEDHEEAFLKPLMEDEHGDLETQICTRTAGYCNENNDTDDDYDDSDEGHSEL